jgi:hypothetical protein
MDKDSKEPDFVEGTPEPLSKQEELELTQFFAKEKEKAKKESEEAPKSEKGNTDPLS